MVAHKHVDGRRRNALDFLAVGLVVFLGKEISEL